MGIHPHHMTFIKMLREDSALKDGQIFERGMEMLVRRQKDQILSIENGCPKMSDGALTHMERCVGQQLASR